MTLVLLTAVTPVLVCYSYWTVGRSASIYQNDVRREIRATSRSLAPAMVNDVATREWDQVEDVMRRMRADGTAVALLSPSRGPWVVPRDFPNPLLAKLEQTPYADGMEFQARVGGADWFCRVVPLTVGNRPIGYIAVAQDWTDINDDVRAQMAGSMIAALLVIGAIVAIIPLAVRRYVSEPLAELSRRVTGFTNDELRGRPSMADEVSLLTEEFKKLDEQLDRARRDLLERHRRELELERSLQQAERLATVGTMASGLAHEIGTPMGVIRGRAEHLLHSEQSSEKMRRGLEVIINQIDRVSRIVRMLLDYGRRRECYRTTCDVRQIINNTLSLMETEAARRRVTVVDDLGDRLLYAHCDAGQIQQVFVNLVMNALDAMMPSGGTLRISASSERDSSGAVLKLTFADTGIGVAPGDAERVFDPFFTTKEPGSGTGMGLAISQSIMRDHGGNIGFDTGPDGSRFFVTLPTAAGVDGWTPVREQGSI